MIYREDDYLLLSGIQHFAFCPRQWALIHIEKQWTENILTAGGRILHNKVHDGDMREKRGDLVIYRALKVRSTKLGITGECDIVEFHRSEDGITLIGDNGLWQPFPVEYKRGKTKTNDCDRLQLCAQALCLEEMLCTKIESGALFYGEPRRREIVNFSLELRQNLEATVKTMHDIFSRNYTPKAVKRKNCQSCSLKTVCLPILGDKDKNSVKRYMEMSLE